MCIIFQRHKQLGILRRCFQFWRAVASTKLGWSCFSDIVKANRAKRFVMRSFKRLHQVTQRQSSVRRSDLAALQYYTVKHLSKVLSAWKRYVSFLHRVRCHVSLALLAYLSFLGSSLLQGSSWAVVRSLSLQVAAMESK